MSWCLWLACEQSEARPSSQATISLADAGSLLCHLHLALRVSVQRPTFLVGGSSSGDCPGSIFRQRDFAQVWE